MENNLEINRQRAILNSMSEAVLQIDNNGEVRYFNAAARKLFGISQAGGDLSQINIFDITKNRKNKKFQQCIRDILNQKEKGDRHYVPYRQDETDLQLCIHADKLVDEGKKKEMLLIAENVTAEANLRRFERDSAITFTSLIICICLYLFVWSLLEFTLGIHLKTSRYTMMIEAIAFILFLIVLFFTSLSLKDVGVFVSPKKFGKTLLQSLPIALITCAVLVVINIILRLSGHPMKSYFIGGSITGAVSYISVAVLQEFLSRGVIQTSIRFLVKARWQKFINVVLSSLIFTLMHLPFGFPFMMGAFVMGIALGIIFGNQKNIWGCALLHWCCGYLAMAMFF